MASMRPQGGGNLACDRVRSDRFAQFARALAGLALAAALAPVALAQPQMDEVRHPDDGRFEEWTRGLTPNPLWVTLDTAINPMRPELGNSDLLAEVIAHEFFNLMSANAYPRAEQAAEVLIAVAPAAALSHYNHACVLSRRGKTTDALNALERAIDLGWRRARHMSLDPDLDNIRHDPRYGALIEKLDAHIEAERIVPIPLRTDPWENVAAHIETEVGSILERHHVPGVSIALIREGETVWSRAFGTVDRRTNERMTNEALFKLAVPARVFAAVVALDLQEQGVWDLDDPIVKYLPDLVLPVGIDPAEVTIRRVLNYTAGITYDDLVRDVMSTDEEIRTSFGVNPDRVGHTYTYTPGSTMLVGRAIEHAIAPADTELDDDEALYALFATRVQGGVLRPLRMQRTLARMPNTERFQIAVGHTEYGTPYRTNIATPLRPGSPYHTTAADLGRLIEFLMNSPSRNGRMPLGARSLAELYDVPIAGDNGFGLGIHLRETEFGRCAELMDVRDGAGSLIRWYPESKSGVVVLFNSSAGFAAAQQIAHLALGGI